MGDLRLFLSSGECFHDSTAATDGSWELPTERAGDRMRQQLKSGLYLYHDRSLGYLLCPLKATLDVEQQFVAEYRSSDGDIYSGFRSAVEAVESETELTVQQYDDGVGSIYWALDDISPREPKVGLDALRSASPPYQYGAPDERSALALYRSVIEQSQRVLISRSGPTEAMPKTNVAILPYESEELGVPVGDTKRAVSAPSREPDADETETTTDDEGLRSIVARIRSLLRTLRS